MCRGAARQCFGLSNFQFHLAKVCGFCGVRSCHQFAFFQEVAPAHLPVFRALTGFELLNCDLCALPALDNFDHSAGLVGPAVVADDGVGSFGFVACQRPSLLQLYKNIFN